ncbi:hypothetical protein RFI_18466, partial [Reticulomyxa filosa]
MVQSKQALLLLLLLFDDDDDDNEEPSIELDQKEEQEQEQEQEQEKEEEEEEEEEKRKEDSPKLTITNPIKDNNCLHVQLHDPGIDGMHTCIVTPPTATVTVTTTAIDTITHTTIGTLGTTPMNPGRHGYNRSVDSSVGLTLECIGSVSKSDTNSMDYDEEFDEEELEAFTRRVYSGHNVPSLDLEINNKH